ncbi:MAG: site-specific DNA-methyltransferase [Verrucomicrobiales bacterium]|nr:site-specific DNA-methyltransferase [Verrucomicrobiales bacterium]
MFSRLKIARNLLREDGVIFISIDDHEVANLQKLCAEVIGADSIIGTISNRRRQVADNRNLHRLSTDHEYILVCAKSEFRMTGTDKDLSKYSNPDKDPRGAWMSDNMTGLANKEARPNLHYDIVDPETEISYPPHQSRGWAYEKSRITKLIEETRILWPNKPDGRPRIKRFVQELKDTVTGFSTVQKLGYTTEGTREMIALMGQKVFDFPKPVSMLRSLCGQAIKRDEDDIILDFFSGSATTAHAVMKLNAEDGGNRRHIMVQLPEACDEKSAAFKAGYSTIAEIGKERIRRAGAKIRAELESQLEGELPKSDKHQEITAKLANLDTGFRVLKVDSSNMADVYYHPDQVSQDGLELQVENIKSDRSPEDLLFQVLLDWGVELSLGIKNVELEIKNSKGKPYTVFMVDDNALLACFDSGITEEVVQEMAKLQPLRAVFRDASFTNDATKINIEQIFKLISPHTELRTL